MKLIYILITWLGINTVQAANPAIIYGSGGFAKNLASSGIELASGLKILDLANDPSSVATDAVEGSFGAYNKKLYVKQDNGSTTNWSQVLFAEDLSLQTFQETYDYSSNPQITLDSVSNGFKIKDNVSPIGAPFFEITSNDELTTYFSVSENAVDILGDLTVVSTTEASTPCPIMTEVQRDALSASAGECIFNSDSASLEFYDGFNWLNTKPNGIPTMAKGALFASNGVTNGEFAPCADGQRLEWDSTETAGIKCVTPAAPSGPNFVVSASSGAPSTCDITAPSITTTGGPVSIRLVPADDSIPPGTGGFSASIYQGAPAIFRDGVEVFTNSNIALTNIPTLSFVDVVAAGTYTYRLKGSGSSTVNCQYMKLFVMEMK